MAATPLGRDKTPAPTHPLIKLNVAVAIVCLLLGVSSSLSTAAALLRRVDLMDWAPPRKGNTEASGTIGLVAASLDGISMIDEGWSTNEDAVVPIVHRVEMAMPKEGDRCIFIVMSLFRFRFEKCVV